MKSRIKNFHCKFSVMLFALLITASHTFSQSANLDQARNGAATNPVSPVQWVNGNAGSSNSHYLEGHSTPYRCIISGLSPGAHYFEIEYDIKHGNQHAIDFITHFNRLLPHTQFSHTPEVINPLAGLTGINPTPVTYPIPAPPTNKVVSCTGLLQPATAFNALPAAERVMTMYNGVAITSITYLNSPDLNASGGIQQVRIDFTTNNSTVVFAWGGHIASPLDWCPGFSAANISGSPYHMRLKSVNGSGVGNQDRSLSAAAVIPVPPCSISGNEFQCHSSLATFSVDPFIGYTYTWSLSNNTSGAFIVGSNVGTSITVNTGNSNGQFTVNVLMTTSGYSTTCTKTISVSKPVVSASVNHYYCSSNGGSITTSVSGGYSPYTYLWSNGATTAAINNLLPGSYTVTVTDNIGCTVSATAQVNDHGNLSASYSVQNVSCYGGTNGSISLTISGGTGPYSFNWSNGATTQNISGLTAGSYTVTVTDANGCTITRNATVNQPLAALSASVITNQSVSCHGGNNGSISIQVSGGTAPYTFLWSNGMTTQNISGLAAGTYSVTVTDANGCTTQQSAMISQPAAALNVSVSSIQNVSCYSGNNGSVTLNVSGGTPAYTFNWSNGSTMQNPTLLAAGIYTVTVTDANGCTAMQTATISQPAAPLNVSVASLQNINCYGESTGSITLNVSGGTPAYSYSWSNGATTSSLNLVVAGVYTVVVTDAQGCTHSTTATLSQPAAPLMSSALVTQHVSCYSGSDGAINVTVSGGTAPYLFLWSHGATTQNVNGLSAGTYTVTITDSKGCTSIQTKTITQPAAALNALASAVSHIHCYGGSNGSISLAVSGGTPPYSYLWNHGSTNQNPSGLPAGNYTVTITDANGCTAVSAISLTQPSAPLNSTATVTNQVSCYGGSNGSINLSVSGGTSPYTFLWSTGQTSQHISGLAAGTYTVTVTDANGCTHIAWATIIQPAAALTTSMTVNQQVSCYGGSNGSIVVAVSGGTSPYTFLWNTGATLQNLTGLPAGNYTLTVTDANDCIAIQSATISQPAAPLIGTATVTSNISCFAGNNGSINLNVTGGTAPYSFLWNTGSTLQNLSGLSAGNYSVTITDANGCTTTASAIITQPAGALSASISVSQGVLCHGGNNGSVSISVTGGTPPYNYIWNTGATTSSISGLAAGTYTATITDANGCNALITATISQPASPLSLSSTINNHVSCFGGNNGSVTVDPSGGTTPYSYQWSNGATTQNISGLPAGTYTVTVTDANGCTEVLTAQIGQPAGALTATLQTSQSVSCYGGTNGSIQIQVTQGTAPYTYSWSNGATTQNISGLPAGTYTVTVTDANGCTEVLTAQIGQPAGALTATLQTSQSVSCYGGTNGSIQIQVTQGTAPYTYSWSNGATTQNISGLPAGTYTVTVTDANGCTEVLTAQIGQPAGALTATLQTSQSVSCYGGTNGSIQIQVTQGTAPYTYSWSNGATTQNISGLPAGTYTVTVTDANGCTEVLTAQIGQPAGALTATLQTSQSVSCYGGTNGSIQIQVTQGTAPYTYSWSNGATTQNISGLPAGTYTVTVTDANGCTEVLTAQIGQPAGALTATLQTSQSVSCYGGTNGSIQIQVTQGTAPYTYSWSNGATTQNISGLPAGTYTVTVTDANGCTEMLTTQIGQPAGALTATLQTSQSVSCYGGTNGSIQIQVTQGTAPYTYSWSNGATTQNISGLPAGTYTVTVTDANGCTEMLTTQIGQPAGALTATLQTSQSVSCYGGTNGSIQIQVTQGTAPYTYSWSNGATTQNISGLPAGTYTVTVTDANGCTEIFSHTLTQPAGPLSVYLAAQQNVNCFGGSDAFIDVEVMSGTPPYTYLWNTGATTQDLNNLPAGTYTVTVTDANGCTEVLTTTIIEPAGALQVSLSVLQNVGCYGAASGSISIAVSMGSPPYTFQWSNGATTQNLVNVPAGTYTVTVTDYHGCTETLSATITQPQGALQAVIQSIGNADCRGNTTGSVTIQVTQGTPPYTFLWSNGATTQNISGISAGTYTVTITDANGCTETLTANVTQPAGALSVTLQSLQHVGCHGEATGSITITVTQGTPPYTFNWNNGATTQNIQGLPAGTYTVTVTDMNGCTETLSATITEPLQSLTINGQTTSANCLVGINGAVYVNVSGGTSPYSYSWSNGATTQNLSSVPQGTYTVLVTDVNGCTAQSQFSVTDNSSFNAQADGPTTVCVGDLVYLFADSIPGATYQWYLNGQILGGATYPHFVTPVAGIYTVTIQHACGTFTSQPIEVNVHSAANVSVSPNVIICPGESVQLWASGGVHYLWTPATGLDFPNVPNPVASPATTTVYTVEVINAEGCRATAQVMVTVFCDTLIIPSGYSPNNDGINDGFVIVGIEKFPDNKIWIYNRWGNLVYKANGYKNDWDGYSNVPGIYIGKKVPAGTYFYVLDLGANQKPRQGYIVLRY